MKFHLHAAKGVGPDLFALGADDEADGLAPRPAQQVGHLALAEADLADGRIDEGLARYREALELLGSAIENIFGQALSRVALGKQTASTAWAQALNEIKNAVG